ncbi:MAG: transporter [Deltaproteobacteria bacterium]|nr:transporter [Candidatus Zymogenaceae bacterium]
MKKILFLFLSVFVAFGVAAQAAEINPLATDRADTVGAGKLRLDVNFSAERLPDSSLLLHTPGLGVTWGVSEDTDLMFKFGGFMMRQWPDDSITSGAGDLTIGLKVSPWKGPWGRLGFSIATKLPNAEDTEGLGTDEQDFFVTGLYSATVKNLKINLNAGLAIIGDNTRYRHYDYLFAYGAGLEYLITDHWSIVADVAGTTGDDRQHEIAKVSLGVVGPLAWGWEWGVIGSYGLTPQTPEWSAGLSLSRVWDVGPSAGLSFYTDETPLRLSYYPFPMNTNEAWTVKKNGVYTSLGLSASGFDDDSILYDVFYKDIRVGVANGVDIGFSSSYFLLEDSPVYGDTDGISDLHVNFKVSPWQAGIFRFGFLTDIKLPMNSYNKGLDSGKMDFTGLILASVSYKKLVAHANLGLAIEGNPEELSAQNDFFVVGLGTEYAVTDRISVFGEFYGKLGGKSVTESYMAGGGFRFLVGKCVFFVSGASGFGDADPDWTVSAGLMRLWDF